VTTVLSVMSGMAPAGYAVVIARSLSLVNFLGFAGLAVFGSDGSNSGHGGCALETALLTLLGHDWTDFAAMHGMKF
jgi:hypothetical protein